MSNMPIDCAKVILKTYHQVDESVAHHRQFQRFRADKKAKELEHELSALKEQYKLLKNELSNRDKHLARLNKQLIDSTYHMERLQEDFENVIYQLTERGREKS